MQGTDGISKNANPVFSAVSQKYEEQKADVKYNKSDGSACFPNVRGKSLHWEYLQGIVTLSQYVTAAWCS